MAVEFKDYYDILGVTRDAGDVDIKRAFHKLAHKYHPDIAKNKQAAEEKFKEINEAHEVLSDPEKRRKYDELGADWNQPEWQSAQRPDGAGGGFGGGTEFHFEGTGFSDFFEEIFGRRDHSAGGFGSRRGFDADGTPFAQRGQDVEGDILVTLDEVLHGSKRTIKLQRTDPRTGASTMQTLRVDIPPGIREAQPIRLAGVGSEGIGGGDPGNLYLRVKYAQHPDFRVRGADLYHDLELTPWEAVLGAAVHIPTLDGRVSLRIPAGTAAGRKFRLRGKGLPAGSGTRGDLYAIVAIQVPEHVTPEEQEMWEKLAARSTFKPRENV